MKVSVLMSVYKSEKPAYLDRSLQSVWDDQTLKPNEIILVQDGPVGEELEAVINKWKEKLAGTLVLLVNNQRLTLSNSTIHKKKRGYLNYCSSRVSGSRIASYRG